jgi:hypothetical protein
MIWNRKFQEAAPPRDSVIAYLLEKHFGKVKPNQLTISERKFPSRVRADLHGAMEQVINDGNKILHFSGVRHSTFELSGGVEFSGLMVNHERNPALAVPPQYEQIDIGTEQPLRCLKVGLWLLEQNGIRYAVFLSPAGDNRRLPSIRFQVATFNDVAGIQLTDRFFSALEKAVNDSRSYRGKILSLEADDHYTGRSIAIKVHKLRTVKREQVILPEKTLALLERNILQFVQRRDKLAKLGQATKKGILFYGPPGTGKSHTIHFLAGALTGHTMLLITAAQAGVLSEYMALARLLQPSIVVIEDVDLIARDRAKLNSPAQESLLNQLLNEMDGLKEDADILFILTTNQPEVLESALSSRPGRVDQAIEFPLPDAAGREKLVRLYGGNAEMSEDLIQFTVNKTDRVSAAFIKELMRRSVQFQLEREGNQVISIQDVQSALDEMLFSGGALNVKLLGGNTGKIGFHTMDEC